MKLDAVNRRLVEATQAGLPLVERPYDAIAEQVGIAPAEVMTRLQAMHARGVIRRIGAVPNHYRLGYRANGMSVWDVLDERIAELGPKVGALDCVSHCYRRPRVAERWRYNLFAMVHGKDRAEVMTQVKGIADLLGAAAVAHDVLFSTKILKKSGLRLAS